MACWLVILSGCNGSGSLQPPVLAPVTNPRIESAASPGRADDFAAELILVAGSVEGQPSRLSQQVGPRQLAESLNAMALAHLRAQALGVGNGPDLAGSSRIRRLAQDPQAPPDLNGDGNNWDETLQAETARVATYSGAMNLGGMRQPLFPWSNATSELQQPLAAVADPPPEQWRARRLGNDLVYLADIGGAMRARVLAGQSLLREKRGNELGATPEDGLLGLLLTEQLLAIDEELLTSLFTGGASLGPLTDPATYDPATDPRWLPGAFEVILDEGTQMPTGYRVVDGASDLIGLASVLQASAELVWQSGSQNPSEPMQEVFTEVFPPPEPPTGPSLLSWDVEISPVLTFYCAGCHLGVPTGGFSINSYSSTLQGGLMTQALGLPMVVPGDHQASMLYTIVVGPPPPFFQMPLGSTLPPAEVQLIADWIDQGALEFPPEPPAPPVPGEDLSVVLFRNLVALHYDPATGALHHRYEVDGPSGVASAEATGRTMLALARLAAALPELEYESLTPIDLLREVAKYAAEHMVDDQGRVVADVDFANGVTGPRAELQGQAALTAGLLAAAAPLQQPHIEAVARSAAEILLQDFASDGDGLLLPDRTSSFGRYTPAMLVDVVAALRVAGASDVPGAAVAMDRMLSRLRPVLAQSEWNDLGEVLGDGIADTDGNGVVEPDAAAGNGRMPLLAGSILVGDPAEAGPSDIRVSWSEQVRPLLFQKCADCHFSGSSRGDYRLDTVRLASQAGVSGGVMPLIVPGDADASLLYRKLVDRVPPVGEQMPLLDTPLDDHARELVRAWIDQGATAR